MSRQAYTDLEFVGIVEPRAHPLVVDFIINFERAVGGGICAVLVEGLDNVLARERRCKRIPAGLTCCPPVGAVVVFVVDRGDMPALCQRQHILQIIRRALDFNQIKDLVDLLVVFEVNEVAPGVPGVVKHYY